MTIYNNVPQAVTTDSAASTVKLFNQFGQATINLDGASLDAAVGFFTSRGFEKDSAESIAYIILKQARLDGYNPFNIIDTLQNLDNLQISALVTEILNYNRFKTSSLGLATAQTPVAEIERNILA